MRKFYFMPNKNGVDITCDQCGETTFVKRVKERTVTEEPEYEPAPEGWSWSLDSTEVRCPNCNKNH